jgi:hypothetical protein
MGLPIVLLTGPAGSGKDTVAAMMAEDGGAIISLADPLKRYARDVLGFSEEALWGPSAARNAPDPRPSEEIIAYAKTKTLMERGWLSQVGLLQMCGEDAYTALQRWKARDVFGVEGITARRVLQTLGSDMGRNLYQDVWINYGKSVARTLFGGGYIYDKYRGLLDSNSSVPPRLVVISDGRFANEVIAVKEAGGRVLRIESTTSLLGEAAAHVSETEMNNIPRSWYDYVLVNQKKYGLESLKRAANVIVIQTFPNPATHTLFPYFEPNR